MAHCNFLFRGLLCNAIASSSFNCWNLGCISATRCCKSARSVSGDLVNVASVDSFFGASNVVRPEVVVIEPCKGH